MLNALREEMRNIDLTPVVFDFEPPVSRDLTNTIRTLAGMSKYVIADITSPRRILQEIEAIISFKVPIKFILKPLKSEKEYDVSDWLDYPWVCDEVFRYRTKRELVTSVADNIIVDLENTAKKCARLKRKRTLK